MLPAWLARPESESSQFKPRPLVVPLGFAAGLQGDL
jgi:hypothetical protein